MSQNSTSPAVSGEFVRSWDLVCGIVFSIVFVVGSSLNLLSLSYFIQTYRSMINSASLKEQYSKKRLFFGLFIVISAVDLIVCVTILPVQVSFLHYRKPLMFHSNIICHAWGLFWSVLPYLSVFLVAVMSFHRTYVLLRPLSNPNPNLIFITIFLYLIYLMIRGVFPLLLNEAVYKFFKDQMFCIEDSKSTNWYWNFKTITNQIQLLLPIFPITISCMLSFFALRRNVKVNSRERVAKMQKEATKTILAVTAIYLLCNVPVAVNYIYYYTMMGNELSYNEIYKTVIMHWYSWPLSYIGCIALNSLINPLVYICRMVPFRQHTKEVLLWSFRRVEPSEIYSMPHTVRDQAHTVENVNAQRSNSPLT